MPLAGALLPVLRLLDLGVGRALTRSVAMADGTGDATAVVQVDAVAIYVVHDRADLQPIG